MKSNISLIAIFLVCLSMVSCKKYLDVAPDNVGTIDYAFRLKVEAEKYLTTCYNAIPLPGRVFTDPAFMATDEISTVYPPTSYFDPYLYRIVRGEQNKVSPFSNYWDGSNGPARPLFQGLRECNIFLENVVKVPDLSKTEKAQWIAEVKTIKAYMHFYMMRQYGPIPVIKTSPPISSDISAFRILREPIDSVINYIVQLLDEAAPDLPDKIYNESTELGRITKTITLALKARVLLTAASPFYNGNTEYINFKGVNGEQFFNQTYSVEKWQKATAAIKDAIDQAHKAGAVLYTFVPKSNEKMTAETKTTMNIRGSITDKWNAELIWGSTRLADFNTQAFAQARLTSSNEAVIKSVPTTNQSIKSMYAPPLHIAEMFYSKNGVPIEEDLTYDYANRFTKLRKSAGFDTVYIKKDTITAQLNYDREPRYYADLGFDGGLWYGHGLLDDAKTWHIKGKGGELASRLGAGLYSVTGYWPKKLANYKNEFGNNSEGYVVQTYPWPMIRLAELYLWYAEALNEVGPSAEQYQWIDLVRARAGLKGVVASWARHSKFPAKPNSKDGFREIVQRESMIEVLFEGKRYWDLIRWKTATKYMNTPILGWDIDQKSNEFYYRVKHIFTPIFTSKNYLWPIAEYSLIRNPDILQNPGW